MRPVDEAAACAVSQVVVLARGAITAAHAAAVNHRREGHVHGIAQALKGAERVHARLPNAGRIGGTGNVEARLVERHRVKAGRAGAVDAGRTVEERGALRLCPWQVGGKRHARVCGRLWAVVARLRDGSEAAQQRPRGLLAAKAPHGVAVPGGKLVRCAVHVAAQAADAGLEVAGHKHAEGVEVRPLDAYAEANVGQAQHASVTLRVLHKHAERAEVGRLQLHKHTVAAGHAHSAAAAQVQRRGRTEAHRNHRRGRVGCAGHHRDVILVVDAVAHKVVLAGAGKVKVLAVKGDVGGGGKRRAGGKGVAARRAIATTHAAHITRGAKVIHASRGALVLVGNDGAARIRECHAERRAAVEGGRHWGRHGGAAVGCPAATSRSERALGTRGLNAGRVVVLGRDVAVARRQWAVNVDNHVACVLCRLHSGEREVCARRRARDGSIEGAVHAGLCCKRLREVVVRGGCWRNVPREQVGVTRVVIGPAAVVVAAHALHAGRRARGRAHGSGAGNKVHLNLKRTLVQGKEGKRGCVCVCRVCKQHRVARAVLGCLRR